VLVPGGATTGPLTVTTVAGPAISATSFIVTQSPSISGVSPCICATGATVQINGANLANVLSVTFGGVAVTDIISYSATRVTVVVPTGAVSGDVVVTTGSGTATSTAAFTLAPVHTFPAGLAMISVPADYSAQAVSETLGLASPVLAIWNPATFAYDATPSPDVATLAVGRAYWARLPQGASINSIGNATPTTTPFLITLQAGWNMIGDPFPIDEPLTGITVNGSGGAAQSIASATDSGLIGSGVWAYNGSAYSQATALSPYQGYWVYTTTSCTLSVPPPAIQLGPFVSGSH